MRWPLVWRSTLERTEKVLGDWSRLSSDLTTEVEQLHAECRTLRHQLSEREQTHEDRQAESRRQIIILQRQLDDSQIEANILSAEQSAALDRAIRAEDQIKELYAEVQRLNSELGEHQKEIWEQDQRNTALFDETQRQNIELLLARTEIEGLNERLLAFTNPKPEPKRSKLTEAIRDQARQPDGVIDRRLLSYFRGEANRLMREEKMSESEVIEAIGDWQTTERSDAVTADKIIAAFNDKAL